MVPQGRLSIGRFDLPFIRASFEFEDLVWVNNRGSIVGQVVVLGHLVVSWC